MFHVIRAAAVVVLIAAGCGGEEESVASGMDTVPPAAEIEVLGNTVCPVMGADVVAGQYFDWEGYRIGICCPGCGGMFASDPQAYIPALIEDPGVSSVHARELSGLIEGDEEL